MARNHKGGLGSRSWNAGPKPKPAAKTYTTHRPAPGKSAKTPAKAPTRRSRDELG